ncbi:response regulator [Pedobacter sp. UC225_65]|uniref:response regulator n=1 Tax=Pedobacter sp. UC225_65 TaxID=3350173 RepID=UPI00366B02D1
MIFDQNIPIEPNNKSIEDMDISSLKVLIAEDNQMNTLLMRKLLAKWNITPDFAGNGSDAVEAFKTNNYDLILMDIHMPIMDGYEASSIIRNYSDTVKSNVPIIALTASVALDVRNKIAEAGINDYVSKPFNPEELRTKLEEIASHKSA